MSDDSKELSRVEDILSGEDYLPKKPMSRVEELLMDGAMVPKVDDTDNGKVLKVIDGEWQPGEDVSGDNLPPVSSLDNGKVLKVVSGEWNIGDDKSESSFVYISSSYPFSGSKVALPANINSVLIANYTSSPKVPTFLVTSNNVIFEPKEVDISTGTTPSVHIRWGRMYSEFDSGTREQNIYNDSLSYNTQNQTTEASYFKTKALQTIPPVDIPDSGKVMQVGNGGTWQANYLPEVDGVPQVTSSDVGKVLKATAEGEYDWGDASRTNAVQVPPVIYDNDKLKKMSVDNFPGLEKVYLTAEEYALLTTAEKEDLSKIYYISQYKYFSNEDGSLIVRRDGNGDVWIFFHGWVFDDSLETNLPEGSAQYCTSIGNSYGYSDEASTTRPSTSQPLWVRFNGTRASAEFASPYQAGADIFWPYVAGIYTDPVYGKLKIGEKSGSYAWTDPYDTGETIFVYYGNKQYTDFDIPDPLPAVTSSDNGKVLKVVSGAWAAGADEGGSEAVYKTLAEYEALTTSEKEDPTKIYFVINEGTKVSPTLAADDGNCNATNAPAYAWWCLSGDASTEFQITDGGLSEYNSPGWWSYHFNTRQIFSKVKMRYRNNSSENRVRFSIQASNDGSTWTEILVGNPKYVDLTTENTDMEFVVDTGNVAYEYIRLRFDMPSGWASGAIKICGNLEIFATANSSSPMIYYKNLLYTPNELPITSTSDTGKILAVNANGVWDKATNNGINPVRLSKAAYDALTPAQKADESKLYLIDGSIITDETLISPDDLAADDGKVIGTSGTQSSRGAWCCFNGNKQTSGYDGAFNPAYNSDPCYVGYHFTDKAHRITKVKYRVYWQGNSGTITNSIYVEGSNDGTNWIDIGGGTVAMSIEESSYSDYEVPCDLNEYSYVRIRFANPVNVTGSNKFLAVSYLEIYATETAKVYNAICYNGSEYASLDPQHYFKEISQTDYDELPDTKNSDGIIYFITDNS